MSDVKAITSRLQTVVKSLEAAAGRLGGSGSAGAGGASAAFVDAYQALVDQHVAGIITAAGAIGDDTLKAQAQLLMDACHAQKDFLSIASQAKKPSDADLGTLLKPTSDLIAKITELKEKNRTSKVFNNLSTISEGIGALGWVCVAPAPGPFVAEARGSAEFYGNRILKDFKGKDQHQVDFVNAYVGFLKGLQEYIKQYHTTGVSWNPKGVDATSVKKSAAPAAAAPAAAASSSSSSAAAAAPVKPAALFADISKGGDVTSGLKKVTADMKTKNMTDKSSVVPAAAVKTGGGSSKGAPQWPDKPAKFGLEGTRWVIEYQNGNRNIVIDKAEPKHTVYIYRCKESTIQVKCKVNSIMIDDCIKSAVVFDTVVGQVEVVNSRSQDLQVTGKVNNITVDKTHGFHLYLNKESLNVSLVTSTSSEMNVSFPKEGEQDLVEAPIPEQFTSTVKNGKLVTEQVQHV